MVQWFIQYKRNSLARTELYDLSQWTQRVIHAEEWYQICKWRPTEFNCSLFFVEQVADD
jgi:hypothetical protein